jgi:hypothetical protein
MVAEFSFMTFRDAHGVLVLCGEGNESIDV